MARAATPHHTTPPVALVHPLPHKNRVTHRCAAAGGRQANKRKREQSRRARKRKGEAKQSRRQEQDACAGGIGIGIGGGGAAAAPGGRLRRRHVQGGRPRRLGRAAAIQARRLQDLGQVHPLRARRLHLVPVPAQPGLGAPGHAGGLRRLRPGQPRAQARRRQLHLQPHHARPRLLHQRRPGTLPQGTEALGRRPHGQRHLPAALRQRPRRPRAHAGGGGARGPPAGLRPGRLPPLRRRAPGRRRRRIRRRCGRSRSPPVTANY